MSPNLALVFKLSLLTSILAFSTNAKTATAPTDLTAFVNPFIGTASSSIVSGAVPGGIGGATQPAAVVPFGLVQIGPDTDRPETSGYKYENTAIRHFSFTHMSGPGCRNMGEFAFAPFVGTAAWPEKSAQTFSHANEQATPGYYSVRLGNGTSVELTATERTGFIRLSFPNVARGENVGLMLNSNIVGEGAAKGAFTLSSDRSTLFGEVTSGRFCASKGEYKVYLALKLEKGQAQVKIENGIAFLSFKNDGRPLVIKSGISLVSAAGALMNLKSESLASTFETVRARAKAKWNQALSKIEIKTSASLDRKKVFYTSLYHSLLHPNIGSDVDGRFLGFDKVVHLDPKRTYYVNFSGWDVYRSQVQLIAFLFPERASDMAQSLVYQGQQGGALPKWSLNSVETNIMSGDPGALIIASMHAFGAENFDRKAALELMKKNAMDPKVRSQGLIVRHGAADYNSLGYIRYSKNEWAAASTALEFTVADNGIAHFAKDVGDYQTAKILGARARNWINNWDPVERYIRPRLDETRWVEPFDPASNVGFMEGNSAQYTWMIPHDLTELIAKMGGDRPAIARLDKFVSDGNAGQKQPHLYLGNEPAFGAPWIYLWAHAAHRTQEVVRELLSEQFKNEPGGLPGNDDLGALSSWGVWSSLGLFPAIPGSDLLVMGSPEFSEVTVHLNAKTSFKILAEGGETKIYVKALNLDNNASDRAWISAKDLRGIKQIEFEMSSEPQSWGSSVGSEPPNGVF